MNEKEVKRVDLEISMRQGLFSVEVELRNEILLEILNTYTSESFSVSKSNEAMERISLLKTNSITKLAKEIHELQTYKNQLIVEDMMKR